MASAHPSPNVGILHLVAQGVEDDDVRTVLKPPTDRVPMAEKHSELRLVLSARPGPDRILEYSIPTVCICASDLVLAVDNPEDVSLDALLQSVELIGSRTIDGYRDHVDAVARVSCALFKKRILRLNGVTYLPLPLAHSTSGQLIPRHRTVVVRVRLRPSVASRPRLIVRGYVSESRALPNFRDVVYQHQGPVSFPTKPGRTVADLPFYHLVTHIAFWGVDLARLRKVRLVINEMALVDCVGGLLAYEQRSRLDADSGACILFLTADDVPSAGHVRSALNMSRIDSIRLEVETAEDDPAAAVHVLALNLNVAVWDQDLGFGMNYSFASLPSKPEPSGNTPSG